jgi:hypothetical protein
MSALPATLLLQDSGDETYEGFRYEETYQVFTTDASDNGQVALTASGLPSFDSPFSGDPLARVSSRRPTRQADSLTHWHVQVQYTRQRGNQQDTQQPPTLRPVRRSASIRWVQKALQQGRTLYTSDTPPVPYRQSILTSAKTPFNPPIEIQLPHPVARFVRWEESFSTQTMKDYVGKVNSTPFGAYDAGWVMCTNIEASEEWEQDADGNPQKYWMVTYEFEACYNESDTFDPIKVLDADFWFLDPSEADESKKRKSIYIKANGTYTGDSSEAGATPVPSPVPISGGLVGDGPIWRLPTDSDDPGDIERVGDILRPDEIDDSGSQPSLIHYLEFNIYETADFNALGLPVD